MGLVQRNLGVTDGGSAQRMKRSGNLHGWHRGSTLSLTSVCPHARLWQREFIRHLICRELG